MIFGTPWPHGTGQCIYWKPILLCASALRTFNSMHKFFYWRNILSWVSFGSDLDPNRFCKCKQRKRERETGACTSFRECIGGSASRERERERERERDACVFFVFFLISSFFFFDSENLPTYFKVSCRSLQRNLIVRDVFEWLTVLQYKREVGICADGKEEP